jgi:phosphohistidine phosphatase
VNLLLVRHAIAMNREDFAPTGKPDTERPLTADGLQKMRKIARGLAQLVPTIDLLASSPLVRAQQTAEVLAEAYGRLRTEEVKALAPGEGAAAFLDWLRRQRAAATIAGVGHEPDLGLLASWLLASARAPFIELKKGAACLLEFDGPPKAGGAILRWALTPSQLRRMGK